MIDITRRTVLFAFLLALAAAPLAPASMRAQPANITFGKSDLTIESGGKSLHFNIEMADTDERRALGPMYRTTLPAHAGTLVDLQRAQDLPICLRHTRLPL